MTKRASTIGLTTLALLAGMLACANAATAQSPDLRDVVVQKDGKEVRGRIAHPFADGPLVLLQGNKRVRVERESIASIDDVASRLAEFFRRRQKLHDKPAAQRLLFEWASSHGLERMAQLHAMESCLRSDDSFGHEALGHERRAGIWLWPHRGRQLTLEQFQNALASDPLALTGERFTVRIDGNLLGGVHALLDLERMGVHWMSEFGAALQLDEALDPVVVDVRATSNGFQKWGFKPMPWHEPKPHGDVSRTFYASAMQARPQRLFFAGAHGLLYRTLIGETNSRDDRDRVCAWLEIGLSMAMETTMQGDAGWAEPGLARAQNLWAAQAITREIDLVRLMHQPMFGGFYLLDDAATQGNWALATTFTLWALRSDTTPPVRDRFLAYIRSALGNRRSESTTAFERAMGKKAQEFATPFREWLAAESSR